MAIRVGVQSEESSHTVVIENARVGYRQAFEVYQAERGPYGESVEANRQARDKALEDARDWVTKFARAGLEVELVEFFS